ncbi:CHASE2 domain-containing protein [Tepidibacter hydrothermalis]|uniref:Adenylate/guanylate cyclase domain-containing protein n=1 Tax=Tepidibacter hydrothermalis TaxID=3036126 RepID=A0ABY8EF98_9FIRM|nr:adenylate/guanylate cyclase domain-containing protein [Tepidibacter hydrothermalis]WFD10525.1 adenylate/guanylate cyclase domain-containing protein [Tepidibacter hydrothermalis]
MKRKSLYIVLSLFIFFAVFSYFDSFEYVESKLGDAIFTRSKLKNKSEMSKVDTSNIIIIGIDDLSLEKLGQWPWPRSYHAKLVDIISKGNPAAIGIDIIFSESSNDINEDIAFAKAIEKSNKVVLSQYGIFEETSKLGQINAYDLIEPIEDLKNKASVGHINVFTDKDGVVRRELVDFKYENEDIKSFDYQIYNKYLESTKKDVDKIKVSKDKSNRRYINFVGKARDNIADITRNTDDLYTIPYKFKYIPFSAVLEDQIYPEIFKDKIVLIGPYTLGIDDYYYTPMDTQERIYGVEIHANIIQSYIDNSFKQNIPDHFNIIILLIFSLIGFILFEIKRQTKVMFVVIPCIYIYIYIAKRMYNQGVRIQLIYPIGLLISVYVVLWILNYISEIIERKRITNIFGKYVAPQVVNEIIKGGEDVLKLGGTRREITTLFVDIRGFTPLSEKAQAEEVIHILNDYLELCEESVFKNGGTVDKFIGDATMAIFNAPLDLNEHAFKAVKTAWDMKIGSQILQDTLQERFGHTVQFGIGINTGDAVVGNIGSKHRMDYTAIGDSVNTAARLESNAKGGQILMSKDTYEMVKDKIEAKYLGEIKVKGKVNGVLIYELEGIKEEYEEM